MNKIQEADFWILDNIFQKSYEWIWKKCEISNFTISKNCYVFGQFPVFIEFTFKHDILMCIFALLMCCFVWGVISFEEKLNKKTFNHTRYSWQSGRIFQWVMSLIFLQTDFLIWYMPILTISVLCSLYFLAVQPLPPCKRKKEIKLTKLAWSGV